MSSHADLPALTVEAHDVEQEELDPNEPRTPAWLPLLGAVLFLAGMVAFVATRPPGKTAEQLGREAEVAAKVRAAAQKAAEPEAPPPMPAPMPGAMNAEGQPRKGG